MPLELRHLKGLRTHGGLDLASTIDLAAWAALARRPDDTFFLLTRFWVPEDNLLDLERSTRMPYRLWAEEGHLIATPGNVIDYAFIRREVNDFARSINLVKILCDPWNAQQLAAQLRDDDGLPIDFIQQGYISLSAPTKELKRLIDAGLIIHDANPVMRWCIGNAVATTDAAENLKLDKKKSRQKIDGAAATVNAVAGTLAPDADSEPSVYQSRGLLTL